MSNLYRKSVSQKREYYHAYVIVSPCEFSRAYDLFSATSLSLTRLLRYVLTQFANHRFYVCCDFTLHVHKITLGTGYDVKHVRFELDHFDISQDSVFSKCVL